MHIHLILSACIVESWLNNDIHNSELCINGYDVVCLDRNRHSEGVLLLINSVSTHSWFFCILEVVIVSIMQSNIQAPLTLALFYHPPYGDLHPTVSIEGMKNLPWLTKPVLQAMRRRNSYFRAAKIF